MRLNISADLVIAARVIMFTLKSKEDATGRVPLLWRRQLILCQDRIYDAFEWIKLRCRR